MAALERPAANRDGGQLRRGHATGQEESQRHERGAAQVHKRALARVTFKAPTLDRRSVAWTDIFTGTQAAPWLWWAIALVLILLLLLGGMKLLGLFPE